MISTNRHMDEALTICCASGPRVSHDLHHRIWITLLTYRRLFGSLADARAATTRAQTRRHPAPIRGH